MPKTTKAIAADVLPFRKKNAILVPNINRIKHINPHQVSGAK
jgi:hypothetical protein